MTTPNRPPLWREIDRAWWSLVDTGSLHALPPESDQAACVIRALRDWLVPEETEPTGMRPCGDTYSAQSIKRGERQRLRALLTTEAERAERGK